MLDELTQKLAGWARARNILIVLLLALPFNLFIFPWRSGRLRELSGEASPIIDVKFAYTPDEVYDLIDALGEEGRALYAVSEVTIDGLYPILYSLFLSLLAAFVYRRAFPGTPALQKLALLPYAILLADYAENVSLVVLLLRYPDRLASVARLANLFTTAKFILAGIAIAGVLVGLVVVLARSVFRRSIVFPP